MQSKQNDKKGLKMIEKLEPLQGLDHSWLNKINELVDAVNELHTEAENNARIRATHESNINTNKEKISSIETQTDVIFNRIDMLNFAILDLHTPDGENKAINNIKKQTEKPEPADPYAEQRKWIGKLCKFWNIDKDNATYIILEEVVVNRACRFKAKDDPYLWDHCEPVKPDDDIIYKGK